MLEEMGLSAAKDREASTYSRGMLQRLAIGRALLHSPRVLLLDEPFTGLDHQAREKLEVLLGALRDGERTVLMTTHDVDGVPGPCRPGGGAGRWEDRPGDVRGRPGGGRVRWRATGM